MNICLSCSQEFTMFNKKQKYHSRACKQHAYRKRTIIKEVERKKIEFTKK
ncbi:MAG: hypothetical protein MUO82_09015 [Candidatus Thermoplasmatota archaeon]|nr:hypothetical protein [Candidatus Thermoplasmatota archaeon]